MRTVVQFDTVFMKKKKEKLPSAWRSVTEKKEVPEEGVACEKSINAIPSHPTHSTSLSARSPSSSAHLYFNTPFHVVLHETQHKEVRKTRKKGRKNFWQISLFGHTPRDWRLSKSFERFWVSWGLGVFRIQALKIRQRFIPPSFSGKEQEQVGQCCQTDKLSAT